MAEEIKPIESEREAGVTNEDEDGREDQHTFIPPLYCNPIINMMEQHYCAHPSIPRLSPPGAKLIKKMGSSMHV